jgi:monofunctional biosynthetic peptidoglycan transglycosylase
MEWVGALGLELKAFFRWLWYGQAGSSTPWLRRIGTAIVFFALPAPVLLLLIFRFVPVPGTPEMLLKLVTLNPVRYSWREFDQISPQLPRAVIGSEDENFCTHDGFDWKEIQQSIRAHERHPGKRLRGASTISQQTARTLFLLPVRSWVRKGLEAYLTVLVEALWPKRRILTAYLNLVDWGHGNYGAEAASESYFGKPASLLTGGEAARLAAVLPDPDAWRAVHPGAYVASRTGTLEERSQEVAGNGLDACMRRFPMEETRNWIAKHL